MGNSTGKILKKYPTRFLGKRKVKKPTTIETLTKLHYTIENIEKRETLLAKRVAMQLKLARQNNKIGKKTVALNHMRRKRILEKEIEKLNNAKMNIQQQIITLESAQTNLQTINAMQIGQKAMKTLMDENNIEEVETLRETIEEQTETTAEINTILSNPIGITLDEDELEQELNELIQEDITNTLIASIPLPPSTTPNTTPIRNQDTEPTNALKEMVLA